MIEAIWHETPDKAAQAKAVAARIAEVIEAALAARDSAVIAVPGGGSAGPILDALAKTSLDWRKVTILPGDERVVAQDDRLSNYRLLREALGGTGATLVSLVETPGDRHAVAALANARLPALGALDLVWLGMGDGNGHTASIFHGPDYEAALSHAGPIVGVLPDPLPPEAPVARVTLSLPAIVGAGTVIVTIAGASKRAIMSQALADGATSDYPIGRVLAATHAPAEIYWSDE